MNKKTIVIGASTNPERYSYKAVRSLLNHGHEVIPIGIKEGELFGLKIRKDFPMLNDVHTVTLYLGKNNQDSIVDYIINLKPKRVIFNPGTENIEFENLLIKEGIETEISCTLVMLSTDSY